MVYTYKIREDIICDEDGKKFTVYGLDAFDNFGNVVHSVKDVFFDREKTDNLIERCNKLKPDIIHLYDIIEDAID